MRHLQQRSVGPEEVEASSAEEVPDGNARSSLNLEYRQTLRDIAPPPKESNSGNLQNSRKLKNKEEKRRLGNIREKLTKE